MFELLTKNKKVLGIAFGIVGPIAGGLIALDKVEVTTDQHGTIAAGVVVGVTLIVTAVKAFINKKVEPPKP